MEEWAKKYDIECLVPTLTTSGFTKLFVIMEMDENDINSLGITQIGTKKKLLIAIRSIKDSLDQNNAKSLKQPVSDKVEIVATNKDNLFRHCSDCHLELIKGHKDLCKLTCPGFEFCKYSKGHEEEKTKQKAENKKRKKLESEEKKKNGEEIKKKKKEEKEKKRIVEGRTFAGI